MEKYYLYCNSNQAYHALMHNSIFSSALTQPDFAAASVGFLSQNCIFITKEQLPQEIRALGATDIYYPITIEIEDSREHSVIPVHLVTRNEDAAVTVSEELTFLGSYAEKEHCVGAFVYGEIPISFISAIWFENETEKVRFRKSSPDLWFPTELFRVRETPEQTSELTKEELRSAAAQADALFTDERKQQLDRLIRKRDKRRAALYFMVEGTENWEAGRVKSNVDSTLIRNLDRDGELKSALAAQAEEIRKSVPEFSPESFLDEKDEVFDIKPRPLNAELFVKTREYLYDTPDSEELNAVAFHELIRKWSEEIKAEDPAALLRAAEMVEKYVYTHTEMDPDRALAALASFPVLKALMFFLDQQKNGDFLRNACRKLSSRERRYALMLFGAYHGMTEVDGRCKSSRLLERRIEEAVYAKPADEALISAFPPLAESTFCRETLQKNKNTDTVGITPELQPWYDCGTAQQKLLQDASGQALEKIYKLMKDADIPEEEIYALAEPITITIACGGKTKQFTLEHRGQSKGTAKEVEKALTKLAKSGEVFQPETFKKYLADPERFSRFYKKNCDKVQEFCRKAH